MLTEGRDTVSETSTDEHQRQFHTDQRYQTRLKPYTEVPRSLALLCAAESSSLGSLSPAGHDPTMPTIKRPILGWFIRVVAA